MTTGTVFLATIVLSAPEFGVAVVVSSEGSAEIKHMFLAHLPVNDARSGAIQQANYVDGTAVVCLRDTSMPNKAYILAPANYALGDIDDSLYGRANYNLDPFTETQSVVFTTALENLLQGQSIDFQNFAHGADSNAIPGDTDIIDQNGNAGLHIGRTLAQLRGSPAAFIDVSNITNAIRQVAEKSEQHLPLSVILAGKELIVHDVAVTEAESFGIKEGQPLKASDGGVVPVDENTIPLYRLQSAEGAAIDGKEELVVGFPFTERHYCNTEPPILAKKRTSLSGALSEASANGIISIKSPAIEAIHQVNYDKNRSLQEQQDILKPWEYPDYSDEEQKPDTDDQISDAAINKLIDKLFTGDYLERLKKKMAEHGLQVSTKDGLLSNQIKGSFKTGPTTKQQYGLPDSITLTDPVTGKETTYYATTSFISQEPDGSILICDGYGSEIRMSRGNIYISPALDLFFRPGRDLSAMVPRHQSYNAQADTTINSSKSIYMRAINNLKMAGATGGAGIVSLECDSTVVTGSDSGLLLKSKCGATLVGADLYLGINTATDTTKANISQPTRAGTIIIDACANGVISMRSNNQVLDTGVLCVVASTGAAGSALLVRPDMIGAYAKGVELTASVNMVGMKDAQTVSVIRDGAEQQITLYGQASPSLTIGGSLLLDKDFMCNSRGLFCGSLIANGVGSTSQYCGVVEKTAYNDPFKKRDIEKLDVHDNVGNDTAKAILQVSNSIYQDWFINMKAFSFPVTYNVDPELRVPGMMWQVNTSNLGKPKMWKEVAVSTADGTATMCYPGAEIWNTATISLSGYTTANLNTGYITNLIEGQ